MIELRLFVGSREIKMNEIHSEYSDSINPSLLSELGQGAEGKVFEISNSQDLVYKEFFVVSSSPPNLVALERLVEVSMSMKSDEKKWLDERALTPKKAIVENRKLRGYLMKKIPKEFYCLHGVKARPRNTPCDWNFLSMRHTFSSNNNLVSDVPVLSTKNTLELLLDLSKTIEIFHRYDIILGDISGRNLLWSSVPKLKVLLIDCDGFRVRGSGSVNHPKQTPDWMDPTISNNMTNQSSDIYKLGLAAYRAIWCHPTNMPQKDIAPPPTYSRGRSDSSINSIVFFISESLISPLLLNPLGIISPGKTLL